MPANNAFERTVTHQRVRAEGVLGYFAPAARVLRHRAAAQPGR
jgi:hypothetical protein